MIEFQNSIQDWVPATTYRVSIRSLVDRELDFSYLGDMGGIIFLTTSLEATLTEIQIPQTAISICVFHL